MKEIDNPKNENYAMGSGYMPFIYKGKRQYIYNIKTGEFKLVSKNEKIPKGWKRGRGFSTTTDWKRIWKPLTNETMMIPSTEELPDGWEWGMTESFSVKRREHLTGYRWIYNPISKEKKQLFGDTPIPDGWIAGRGNNKKRKTRFINNPVTKEYLSIDIESPIPDGWKLGLGWSNRWIPRRGNDGWTFIKINN